MVDERAGSSCNFQCIGGNMACMSAGFKAIHMLRVDRNGEVVTDGVEIKI